MDYPEHFSTGNDFSKLLTHLSPPRPKTTGEADGIAFLRLLEIVDHLRGEEGCPFDREQTVPRLLNDLREELHELQEAVEDKKHMAILSEIGDMVLILLFIRRILWEEKPISVAELLDHTSGKMVRRHPHVFLDPDPTIDKKRFGRTGRRKREKKRT